MSIRRPSSFGVSIGVLCAAVAFVAALSYFGARAFTGRAADERAGEEAASFARHSSLLATGDAFSGYLQILSYSEDPAVRARATTETARRDAMQQLLWLNTNKMSALAVADRSGLVLVATDPTIASVRDSTAFNASRANLGPANSDILLPDGAGAPFVEFSAPLRDPDGSVWGFLYARADPKALWRDTLNASIDGGHNVIINSEGRFAAGVPDGQLKQPWKGSPLDNGSVRAQIAGADSICGLGTIGKDTQIDHGWFVASCLPASLIQVEAGRALGKQWQITLAGAVLAAVVSAGVLKIAWRNPAAPAALANPAPADPSAVEAAAGMDDSAIEADGAAPEVSAPEPPPDILPEADASRTAEDIDDPGADGKRLEADAPVPAPVIIADVDALTLIDAYERRNALLAEELRESIQARLMIAATQAAEAYALAGDDPERAQALHRAAISEIEAIRERGIRGIGQELHPSLVRLGLPGALRSLRKEFEGALAVDLSIGHNVDGASGRGGRITIDPRLRLVLYRTVRDAVRAIIDAGATAARVSIERDGLELEVGVRADSVEAGESAFAVAGTLLAGEVALQAFGGSLAVETSGGLSIVARVMAPHVEQPEPELSAAEEPGPDDADLEPGADAAESEPALDAPYTVRSFSLPEREPEIIDVTDDGRHVAVSPDAVTTFQLDDGEAAVIEERDETPDAATEPELPQVVQLFAEDAEEPVADASADGSDDASAATEIDAA